MRLCIADPPYLGVAHKWYGDNNKKTFGMKRQLPTQQRARSDVHDQAALWDDPATHQALVQRLLHDYDGWAIAMAWYNLKHYMQWVPDDAWIAIWNKTSSPPSRSRLHNHWEPVIVYPPSNRRANNGSGTVISGVLTALAPQNFVGAKPRAWTRWVLDMLGYDQDTDTVDDLFAGSGAVADEVAQMLLPLSD